MTDLNIKHNTFQCAMESIFKFNCWVSIEPSKNTSETDLSYFYDKHKFIIGHNFFDPEWTNDIQAEEIFKRLVIIGFKHNDENLMIVRGPKQIYVPSEFKYVDIPERGIFLFDKSQLEVDYEETE